MNLNLTFLRYSTNSLGLKSALLSISNKSALSLLIHGAAANQPACDVHQAIPADQNTNSQRVYHKVDQILSDQVTCKISLPPNCGLTFSKVVPETNGLTVIVFYDDPYARINGFVEKLAFLVRRRAVIVQPSAEAKLP